MIVCSLHDPECYLNSLKRRRILPLHVSEWTQIPTLITLNRREISSSSSHRQMRHLQPQQKKMSVMSGEITLNWAEANLNACTHKLSSPFEQIKFTFKLSVGSSAKFLKRWKFDFYDGIVLSLFFAVSSNFMLFPIFAPFYNDWLTDWLTDTSS